MEQGLFQFGHKVKVIRILIQKRILREGVTYSRPNCVV